MQILIIGATGLLAKPVIQRLDEAGFQLRLFSRSITPSMFEKHYDIVQGDVFNPDDLDKAVEGCDAIHISISGQNEHLSTMPIVAAAKKHGIKLISTVSGCTVTEENRWFKMIDNKWQAEQTLIHSGIPFMIFRPTWFFESLDLMIRDGKASIIGDQPNPYRWVAADDFAKMVARAYQNPEARNKTFFIFGPQQFLMKDLLEQYCTALHPEIQKVSVAPVWLLKTIGFLSGNKELKAATAMFAYFQKVQELGDPTETNALLGKPETTFKEWLKLKEKHVAVPA